MPTASTKAKTTKPRVAVIGSGFGGLATAIRLQAGGLETRIFEKRDAPGGRAYVYRDQGFTFDAGPTVITAPECLDELFALKGGETKNYVEMIPVMPFYRLLFHDGYKFDYSNDDEKLFAQIALKNKDDLAGYKRFLQYSKEVFHEGYTKLAATPFLHLWDMVKVAPQLVKLGAYRSVYSTVSKFIQDEHLRQAFSFHSLLVGGNPFETSSIYTLIHFLERNWGVYFPRGGTGALVQALVRKFEELGGSIQYDSEIAEITTDSKSQVTGVRLKNGGTYECDAIVSNGDVHHTYKDLLKSNTSAQSKARRLEKMSYSNSLVVIYFGTNRKWDNISHHNVIFGPRYKGLLDDIFSKGPLPEDFSLYLHAPSKTDPQLAPAGHEAFYVLAPVGHLGNLEIDWNKEGPIYADKIFNYLEEKYMPGLKASIVTKRIFTPQDFKTELNSHLGAAFSLEPTLTQSAYFRLHNRDPKIKGLYFAGAGTHPGAGVPGVVNSGKATAGLILEDMI